MYHQDHDRAYHQDHIIKTMYHQARLKRELYAAAAALPSGAEKVKAQERATRYQPNLDHSPPYPWHVTPSAAYIGVIQCAPNHSLGLGPFPHWDCVLRRCAKCPKYPIPLEEQGTDDDAPKIKFHIYKTVTECTRHGIIKPGAKVCEECKTDPAPATKKQPKIRSRKHLSEEECAMGTFHAKYYQPALEKLAYHRPHVRILGKSCCGSARFEAFKRKPSVRTRRDYAERLAAAFNLEAQHEHFGNGRSLSMEGSSVETFCKAAVDAYLAGVWQMKEEELKMAFHSHFSDESRQDAATTHAHMTALFEHLKAIGELIAGLVIWDDTDGCGKQYRCGTAMYLLSILASTYGIVIDRAIGAPGHGKDIVDGLNATDKVYLRKAMCMIGTPEADDGAKRMAAHAMLGDKKMSLAVEAARLCSDPARISGVKAEGGKRQKREGEAKVKERHYHVQDPTKVKHGKMSRVAVGFEAGEHNGMLAHYNMRVSKELGVGLAAVRRIPCACTACLDQLEKPWVPGVEPEKQPMFASSVHCIYWPLFKQAAGEPGLNDWKILKLEKKKGSDEDETEVYAEVLAGVETMMAEQIKTKNEDGGPVYGAFATEDVDGFYVIKFTSAAYTLQDDVELKEYEPAIKIKAGALVCDAEYFNKVPGASGWYTEAIPPMKTQVRVQQVLMTDLKLVPISNTNKLPSGMSKKNKKDATEKGALYLDKHQHDMILDESAHREMLEHDEVVDDDSDSESESSEEEEGGE
jgi:hypothetical protein